jgi:Ca2+-binding EF-hand superfamily protein
MTISTSCGNVKFIKANQTMPYKLQKKTFKSKSNRILSKELEDIIRKYYPDYTNKEILELYKEMSDSGCTYSSIANVIIEQLGNDDKVFRDLFGYSLYDNDGNINYNKFSVDIFSCISKSLNK